jgi:hypothetical protein
LLCVSIKGCRRRGPVSTGPHPRVGRGRREKGRLHLRIAARARPRVRTGEAGGRRRVGHPPCTRLASSFGTGPSATTDSSAGASGTASPRSASGDCMDGAGTPDCRLERDDRARSDLGVCPRAANGLGPEASFSSPPAGALPRAFGRLCVAGYTR